MKMKKHQQQMIEDGCPASLVLLDKAARAKAWEQRPPQPFNAPPAPDKTMAQEAAKVLAELEAKKNAKKEKAKVLSKIRKEDRTGQRWDQRTARWVDEKKLVFMTTEKGEGDVIVLMSNTRGSTAMNAIPEIDNNMTAAQLVTAYNHMAESPTGKELGAKTVQRFSDRETAVKRFHALASSIRARREGLKAAAQGKEEDPMPTKAPAKKKTPAAKAKTNGATDHRSKIAQEFGARPGTVREKLLDALHANYRKQVTINALLKAAYGSMNEENKGALMMSLRGAQATIDEEKLPYKIVKAKGDNGMTVGLFPK